MKLTAKKLAKALHKAFEEDSWGDIDPWLFDQIGDLVGDEYAELKRDISSLEIVLNKVIQRLDLHTMKRPKRKPT